MNAWEKNVSTMFGLRLTLYMVAQPKGFGGYFLGKDYLHSPFWKQAYVVMSHALIIHLNTC